MSDLGSDYGRIIFVMKKGFGKELFYKESVLHVLIIMKLIAVN